MASASQMQHSQAGVVHLLWDPLQGTVPSKNKIPLPPLPPGGIWNYGLAIKHVRAGVWAMGKGILQTVKSAPQPPGRD